MTTYTFEINGRQFELTNPKGDTVTLQIDGKTVEIDLKDPRKRSASRVENFGVLARESKFDESYTEFCEWCQGERVCVLPGKCKDSNCGRICYPES